MREDFQPAFDLILARLGDQTLLDHLWLSDVEGKKALSALALPTAYISLMIYYVIYVINAVVVEHATIVIIPSTTSVRDVRALL